MVPGSSNYDHGLWFEQNNAHEWQLKCQYTLTDALGRDAADVELDVLAPDLTLLANPSGDGTVGVRHEQVLYTWPVGQTPSRGRYQLMLRATDQHATADGDTPWNNAWHPYAYRDRERHRLPALTASTYWTESSAYFRL